MTRKVHANSKKLDDVVIETPKGELTVGEIKHSARIQKSATPKYDLSWYIKWFASVFVLAAMSLRGKTDPEWNLQLWDLGFSLVGITGWLIVSFLWKDRALIVLNGVGLIFLIRNLIIHLSA